MNKQNNIDEIKLYSLNLDKKMKDFIPKLNKYIGQRLLQIYSAIDKIYFLDHENDTPYDFSGSLYVDYERNKEDLKNVSDILEQYIGHSIPTYESGCGLDYPTFEELIEQEIDEKLKEIFVSLTESMYNDGLLIESSKEINNSFNETDIIFGLTDYMDEELGLPYDYREAFENIPAIKDNYSIKTLYELYGDDLEYIKDQQELYKEEYQKYLLKLRKECEDIPKYDEFRKIPITKENPDLLSKLNKRYNKRQLSLLAYFRVYRFSKSLHDKYIKPILNEIDNVSLNLKRKYQTKFTI